MSEIRDEDIKAIVAETLAEQHRLHHGDIDAVVLRAIATILTSFGIEEADRRELRADLEKRGYTSSEISTAFSWIADRVEFSSDYIRFDRRTRRDARTRPPGL